MDNYLVATVKDWNLAAFYQYTPELPGNWHLVTTPEQLNKALLNQLKPAFIFFPHWNWKVPPAITEKYRCVCFHMTDLPYGRGGSPLQNLILRGYKTTMLSAIQMTDQLDAGPVFSKVPLSLDGSAQQIFQRAAVLVYQLITRIINQQLAPVPQQGKPEYFTRRTPDQSVLPDVASAEQLYDFIRMLDATGYPAAFLQHHGWKLEFTEAKLQGSEQLTAKVMFIKTPPQSDNGEPI